MSKPSSLQTPRARVKHLGSTRSGTQTLWTIRLTSFALLSRADLASARALLGAPLPAIILILFVLASVWHMAEGMRSVIQDYIRSQHLRELVLMANLCFASGVGLVCAYALLRLSFVQ